jgi:hypothetical protein
MLITKINPDQVQDIPKQWAIKRSTHQKKQLQPIGKNNNTTKSSNSNTKQNNMLNHYIFKSYLNHY